MLTYYQDNELSIFVKTLTNTLEKLQTQAKLIGKPNSTRDICEIILNSKK